MPGRRHQGERLVEEILVFQGRAARNVRIGGQDRKVHLALDEPVQGRPGCNSHDHAAGNVLRRVLLDGARQVVGEQLDSPAAAAQQPGVKLALQGTDLLPDRRGGQVQRPGRAGEIALGRSQAEAAELRQLDLLVAMVEARGSPGHMKF
jgi:hypothetical protein